ncbi:hypothetical protein EJV47_27600 [Hymenobacter gummosus]|uniref:Uncharacterized protein n=1 Tax=Hymenobacter gummosus TaxID=1776032 RepID=A0A3S0H0I1_9BACT|nr:hypothetical protein [Hymenobacter gummosus]RTQ44758.1 hypothetical protein EJV47_27600 [Hymenobacter gummosus]
MEQQAELMLLTELFSAQQRKTGRSFDQADTLHILLEAPSNSGERYLPYAGMLWNSSDTVAFALTYDLASHPVRHAVQYRPFMTSCRVPGGDCSRQALVRLVAGQHFDAAKQLAQANRELGGRYTQVVSATKTPRGYRIVSFILSAFMLPFTDALPFR